MQEAARYPAPGMVTPGWYQDPTAPGQVRWHDGSRWTVHVAPPPLPAPTGPPLWGAAGPGVVGNGAAWDNGPSDVSHWLIPVGRSWQSLLAGYLGLFSLVIFFLAPFSIGFGIWALRVAGTGGHGRGRAWTGIIGGLIGAALGTWAITNW